MNFATFDIECSDLSGNYGFLLCGVVKPLGGKPVTCRIDRYPLYSNDRANDYSVVKAMNEELQKFDVLISYFGRPPKGFDIKFLRTRSLGHHLAPIPPMHHIDLWREVKNNLQLRSNSLASVGEFLDLPTQKDRINAGDWHRATAGHVKAMDRVVTRCVHDVEMTEEAYERLKPFIKAKSLGRF